MQRFQRPAYLNKPVSAFCLRLQIYTSFLDVVFLDNVLVLVI